ncbi:Cfr10I/Bse634I family restriction endonuclease [Spirulina subsalsa FACHB-351]|uniref:Cfr10I/Bse634I family restriction endonuclease n=1 Tax=Spirulina subsalsa FACHB-351 TaxID=234711 RepID=A0ABT3L5F1_9CYAN|nr:Cfr10I/Bse634I family restriction endonuclease [Spirulina subsalsa]MCW6036719.1 Cfr10I/Bse634I family restriction endonuclease [Spirulina subsalsa FACHB-351]
MQWFSTRSGQNVATNSIKVYQDLSRQIINHINKGISIPDVLLQIEHLVKEECQKQYKLNPTVGSLNNSKGRWNELITTSLLSKIVVETNSISQQNGRSMVVFSLPKADTYQKIPSVFLTLFKKTELQKLQTQNIFFSSPDYIIAFLNHDPTQFRDIQNLLTQQSYDPNSFNMFNYFKGSLEFQQVRAIISLKTSNRPDRRYQPLFEAAMIKAIKCYLQVNWQYYMVCSEITLSDHKMFQEAIAPHSIITQKEELLVDGTYTYNKKADLVRLVNSVFMG